jgi:RES domain-containing protein
MVRHVLLAPLEAVYDPALNAISPDRVAAALRAPLAAGVAGVLVPSACLAGGVNLVLWRWNDSPDRTVIPLDPQRDLPRDQSSRPVAPAASLR